MSSIQNLLNTKTDKHFICADLADSDNLKSLFKSMSLDKRWMYLIANNIEFKHKVAPTIQLTKPEDDMVGTWIEKLLVAGQARVIIVENLVLDEVTQCRIKKLCEEKQAIIVNVKVKNAHYGNLVFGPW
ncbi:hypothetical protein EYS14_02480 [Alteromonadaceae bacterium M269]|nr:hypothetical protein EYS14_02480 [Alteromonadaceae bacterium M269]